MPDRKGERRWPNCDRNVCGRLTQWRILRAVSLEIARALYSSVERLPFSSNGLLATRCTKFENFGFSR